MNKKYVTNILIHLMLILSAGVNAQQNNISLERDWRVDRQKIKIMSYNILDGFGHLQDKDRMERTVAWIKEQDPDIISLNELCDFTEADLKEFAASYGHPYSAILKKNGYPVGISSKTPIKVVSRNLDGFVHGMMHCEILGMDILSTHLSPGTSVERKKEADYIVSYIQKNHLTKCILLGDMNDCSPFDSKWTNRDMSKYVVISTFMAASLYDICYMYTADENRYTFPTPILPDVPRDKQALRLEQERIDYIFVTDSIREICIDGCIYNGPENDYLSDHYPVSINLFIPKKKN